jgi:uncharacterized YigZ family protein
LDYTTVKGRSFGKYTDKKSVFNAYLSHVQTEEQAVEFINSIRKKDYKARHHCYAYILKNGKTERQSDDGEPAKTAGMPILNALKSKNLEDAVIVVSRYFGGTLLGTGGLVRAYSQAANLAIDAAEILNYTLCNDIELEIGYRDYDKFLNLCKTLNLKVVDTEFAENVKISVRAESKDLQNRKLAITEFCGGVHFSVGEDIFDIF